jgi:hypothetical protein
VPDNDRRWPLLFVEQPAQCRGVGELVDRFAACLAVVALFDSKRTQAIRAQQGQDVRPDQR